MSLLTVEGVSKRFGGLAALDGVSVTVEGGAIAGLIGPNGSGKSTFFNVVTGIIPSDSGRIVFRDSKCRTRRLTGGNGLASRGHSRKFSCSTI
jgi:ABC-type branched-subunit amino acid transport system ATPase component